MELNCSCYTQQILGTLLEDLKVARAIQIVRDSFAMATTTLDQVARTGAFHHYSPYRFLREYKEFAYAIMSMPLTADGMFGAPFDKKVEGKRFYLRYCTHHILHLHLVNVRRLLFSMRPRVNDFRLRPPQHAYNFKDRKTYNF